MKSDKKPEEEPLDEAKVAALRSNLPARFHTPTVIQGYFRPLPATVSVLGTFKAKQEVPYKFGKRGGETRFMMLHLESDAKGTRYKLSPVEGGWMLPLTREAIMKGICEAEGEWAIVSDTHPVRLDRKKLLAALHSLEAKLKKRQSSS